MGLFGNPIHSSNPLVRQAARFLLSGIFTNIIKYGVFLALLYPAHFHYMLSSALAYVTAFTVAFLINRIWAFEVRGGGYTAHFLRFTAVNIFSFGVNMGVIWLFTDFLGIHPAASQLIAIGASMVSNFCGCKYWAFRK